MASGIDPERFSTPVAGPITAMVAPLRSAVDRREWLVATLARFVLIRHASILPSINPEYAEMARRRITGDSPLFAEVA
jgi:hypothetical protein